jgi:16S rRNA (adenine1518-N6/adenine1519-N6)-dimethyltransferase
MATFSAKKSLGQHFLHAPNVVGAMIHAAKIEQEDIVLEIGPGKGVLTRGLLKAGATVVAVEKDERAIEYLKEEFRNEIGMGKLRLVAEDILKIDPRSIGLLNGMYIIAANIPYYITGEIIRKFLTAADQPKRMVLLVQKEVAKRIVAADGKESILSLSVKAYGRPTYIESVPRRFFRPVPNVDSALILIDGIGKEFFASLDEGAFFKVIRAGFAHKRKFLRGNLAEIAPADSLERLWQEKNWPFDVRAESFSLDRWKEIARRFFSTENTQNRP